MVKGIMLKGISKFCTAIKAKGSVVQVISIYFVRFKNYMVKKLHPDWLEIP